jgi:NADH-quinone oxidoreductase subunit H
MDELIIYFVIFGTLGGAFAAAAVLVWFERRLLGIWQDRYGPNRVGPFGIGLAVADIIKLFAKEDWVPPFADRFVFIFAPTAIVMAMLLGFSVVPYT